ncbi:MAG: DUF4243 domain-containing protein [Pyrinomonadaceae bacterium]|nr:DUF4243 domain-containing protein [Pyrinomonadaceae bacterium]
MNRSKNEKKLTRRTFVKEASVTLAFSFSAPLFFSCGNSGSASSLGVAVDGFDKALALMREANPVGNHGPMAAEALVALGRSDRLEAFVPSFLNSFSREMPPARIAINGSNWKEAIGQRRRITDWKIFFEKEIDKNGWRQLVDKWSLILAPGLRGAATHGVIRTGHAVRSIQRNESQVRKLELAQALGYWAAHYQTLPESKTEPSEKFEIAEAIEKIPVVPIDRVSKSGSVNRRMNALEGFEKFGKVTGYLELSGDPETKISELTAEFSKAYLNKVDNSNVVALVHMITSLASIRTLVPIVSKKSANRLLFYGWQAAAGIYSVSGPIKGKDLYRSRTIKLSNDQLIEKAVNSNEVHAIKFTEACLREDKIRPSVFYRLAAEDAVTRLTR